MLKFLTVPQLAERCRTEAARYKQARQSDSIHCLELFRRALAEQDEAAWHALYSQYQSLVAAWVHGYSRFPQTGEEAAFFINGVFARMWQFASRPETAQKLDSLGKCLQYLKTCVASAIEDYLRKSEQDALGQAASFTGDDRPNPAIEADGEPAVALAELRQALWETVQTEAERLVAAESWVYGLTPRQIQARHPDTLTTVEQVSQIKHNLIKRLRRRLNN